MSERRQNTPRQSTEFPLSASGRGLGGGVNIDPEDEHLRALCAAADLPLPPSQALRSRVAESAARHDAAPSRCAAAARAPRRPWWQRQPAAWGRAPVALAAVFLFTLLGLHLVRWQRGSSPASRVSRLVQRPPSRPLDPAPVVRSGRRGETGTTLTSPRGRSLAPPPLRPLLGWRQASRQPIARTDSVRPVSQAPAAVGRQRTPFSRNGASAQRVAEAVESRLRHRIPVRDDFVRVPFARLASTSDRQIATAVESYQREAAIVDGRLAREVTLEQKAAALSDLCERLRSDTAIQLTAGQSVAEEKVTLFCRKTPLRDVMRQLSRPFGYTWLRSGKSGEYRYELVQDLRSQLLEEELRNRDRNEALLALEQELDRYRPYLHLTPDEIVARAKTAPPAEKRLLEKLGGGDLRSGLGWGPIQMYFRLSAQDLTALRAGEKLYYSDGPRPGERPLPPDVARGVLQSYRQEHILRVSDRFNITDATNDPDGVPVRAVPELRASVTLSLDRSDLGQYALDGLSGFFDPRPGQTRRADSSGPYVTGRSSRVLQPDNASANARLAQDPELRRRITLQPQPSCPRVKLPLPASGDRSRRREATPGAGGEVNPAPEPKLTTADALEALHRVTGMPIIADFYTRLYKPADVAARNRPLFEALNDLADRMRLRWSRERGWLQFRSASFYHDRLKEVPNRLLARWSEARRRQGMLTLEDLVEIAQLSDAQLRGQEMADGARECWALTEWDLARNGLVLPNLRFLAQFTPAQRQEAMSAGGLPFTRMSLAQQQGFLARAFPPTLPGSAVPATVPGIQSSDDLEGAALRVDYQQPGWFEWRPTGPQWLRWVVSSESGATVRRVLRPAVRGRSREDVVQALRSVDPQVREATRRIAVRADPRLETGLPAEEAQIVPTELDLITIYMTGTVPRYQMTIISADGYSRPLGLIR